MKKINSTGTLWMNDEGYSFSYNTQLTNHYKNLRVFNNTFYSMTTRRHQRQFDINSFDLVLTNCKYNTRLTSFEIEKAIEYELDYIDNFLNKLSKKRNTQKKLETIQNLNNRKEFLMNILHK